MPSVKWGDAIEGAEESTDFDIIPKADYHVKIVGAETKVASTGKTMYDVTAQIQDGPFKNRKIWNKFVVSPDNPKAMGILLRHFAVLGLTKEFLATEPSDEQIINALIDREAVVLVGTETYQGEERNVIKNWKPLTGIPGMAPAAPPVPAAAAPTPPVPSTTPF